MTDPSEIVIPELEEEIKKTGGKAPFGRGLRWTQEEEGIMFRYYGRVQINKILLFLPGRNRDSLAGKARSMGLTNRGRKETQP